MFARVVALAVVALSPAYSQGTSAIGFEVASVKPASTDPSVRPCMCESPGRIAYRLTPLKYVIRRAYGLQDVQVEGPDWLMSEKFDIDAKFSEGATAQQLPAMLQGFLAQRFHLSAHTATKKLPGFVLAVGPSGPKMKPANSGGGFSSPRDSGGIHLKGIMTIPVLAGFLSEQLRSPVVDETGLRERFSIALDFAPDNPTATRGDPDLVAPEIPAAFINAQHPLRTTALEPRRRGFDSATGHEIVSNAVFVSVLVKCRQLQAR